MKKMKERRTEERKLMMMCRGLVKEKVRTAHTAAHK